MNRLSSLLVASLIGALLVQGFLSAQTMSFYGDEMTNLVGGYYMLKTNHYGINPSNAPLMMKLGAVPWLFMGLRDDDWKWLNLERVETEDWQGYFLFQLNGDRDVDQLLFWARLPVLLVSALLAYFVYRWSRELYGPWAGLLSLFLCALSPVVLGDSTFVGLDIGLACFLLAAAYVLWRYSESPSWHQAAVAGGVFGLALLAKASALSIFPVFLAALIWGQLRAASAKEARLYRLLGHLVVYGGAALLVLWAGYGFEMAPIVTDSVEYARTSKMVGLLPGPWRQPAMDAAQALPVPLKSFLWGLMIQWRHGVTGHPAYLMGMYSTQGWWYFFPISFLVKTPLSLLVLMGLRLRSVARFFRRQPIGELLVMAPVVLLFLVFSLGHIDRWRYALVPTAPFIFVWVGALARQVPGRQRLMGLAGVGLCAWYMLSSLSVFPHYLAYFNEMVGGADGGYRYLIFDIDQGQGVKQLRQYMDHRGWERVRLSYWGNYAPALSAYGVLWQEMTEDEKYRPSQGVFAVGLGDLFNVLHEDKERFAWLREIPPTDKVGYIIWVWDLRQ